MEKVQAQLPYQSPVLPPSTAPTLFLSILKVHVPTKKKSAGRPKKPTRVTLPQSRRAVFLDIS